MRRKKWNSKGWSLIKHSEFHLRLKEILERAFEEEETEKVRRKFKRGGLMALWATKNSYLNTASIRNCGKPCRNT